MGLWWLLGRNHLSQNFCWTWETYNSTIVKTSNSMSVEWSRSVWSFLPSSIVSNWHIKKHETETYFSIRGDLNLVQSSFSKGASLDPMEPLFGGERTASPGTPREPWPNSLLRNVGGNYYFWGKPGPGSQRSPNGPFPCHSLEAVDPMFKFTKNRPDEFRWF